MSIFDAHFHIIDPKFPLVPNDGYLPPVFSAEDYQSLAKKLNINGGAIVSGSFQAFDQEYLIHALNVLGKGFVGVANIPNNMSDKELDRLNQAGVVAVRFNIKRGGSEKVEFMQTLSNKLYDRFGWHTELYVDSKDLASLKPLLATLPKFSIDHLGLTDVGLKELLYWVERGVKVKATGFGRINFDPIPTMKAIYDVNPQALMFGTDLPSTRARTPFSQADIRLIQEHFSEDALENIFWKNARQFYNLNSNISHLNTRI